MIYIRANRKKYKNTAPNKGNYSNKKKSANSIRNSLQNHCFKNKISTKEKSNNGENTRKKYKKSKKYKKLTKVMPSKRNSRKFRKKRKDNWKSKRRKESLNSS
jgi:hypothetical protein